MDHKGKKLGFEIKRSVGNLLRGGRWQSQGKDSSDVFVNNCGETVIKVLSPKATYLVFNGSSNDFHQLGSDSGFTVNSRQPIYIHTQASVKQGKNQRIALLEYDQNRHRTGEFYIDLNRICRVTLRPETRYILIALRFYGAGEITVHHLQVDSLTEESNPNGPLMEYFPSGQVDNCVLPQTENVNNLLKDLGQALEQILTYRKEVVEGGEELSTYFAPSNVRASKVLEKPSAHFAGRLAADQTNSGNSSHTIFRLVHSKHTEQDRKIVVIGSDRLVNRLKAAGQVKVAVPGQELLMLDSETAYFVIDEASMMRGPWSGVLDAQGTSKFVQLKCSLDQAKNHGSVIVIIASKTPGHYSGMLRKKADILVVNGEPKHKWDDDLYLPVLNEISNYTNEGV